MTPHEQFNACMNFEAVAPPLWEWGTWPSTLRCWQQEGLGSGNTPPQYRDCRNKVQCGVDLWMLPRYEQEVLDEDGEYVIRRTDRGTIARFPKAPDAMSMPEHFEYPVKSRTDWNELKPRFRPDLPGRLPPDWSARCQSWRESGPIVVFQGPRSPSLFGFVRELLGPERTLTAFYDDPDLVQDMMDTITELTCAMLEQVIAEAPLTSVFFWEDMCYKNGPLISPALFREFMIPRYRRMTELARGKGINHIFVDSDGDVSLLIPLWLEAGINGIYPFEVAAGMDVVELRRQYGKDLLMTGGIDKRVLVQGRDAIDAELEYKLAIVDQGGYIPHIDHAIPHDVPYENFVYYWKRKRELLGM